MSRVDRKQERLSVWLRMKRYVPKEGNNDDEGEEIDVDEVLSDADAGHKKPEMYFDLLPAEVLEFLLLKLDHDSLLTMKDLCRRSAGLIEESRILRLHLEDKSSLLTKAYHHEDVRLILWKTPSLLSYLKEEFAFFRTLQDQRGPRRRSVTSEFHFGDDNLEDKVEFLLKVAAKRLEYNRHHVIVVVAGSTHEACVMAEALASKRHDTFFMRHWPSNEAVTRMTTSIRKFFLVVDRLSVHFHFTNMRKIVFFKPLKSVHSHDALHALNPGGVVFYVSSGDREQLLRAVTVYQDLIYRSEKPMKVSRALSMYRSFFEAENSANGPIL